MEERICSKDGCLRIARDGEYWCTHHYAVAMKKLYRRRKIEEARERRKERLNESGSGIIDIQTTGESRKTD